MFTRKSRGEEISFDTSGMVDYTHQVIDCFEDFDKRAEVSEERQFYTVYTNQPEIGMGQLTELMAGYMFHCYLTGIKPRVCAEHLYKNFPVADRSHIGRKIDLILGKYSHHEYYR